jgi:hypothetical protein
MHGATMKKILEYSFRIGLCSLSYICQVAFTLEVAIFIE